MRIDWVGHIGEGFYALGHPSVPVYLMDGTYPALFDAGFTGLAKVYLKSIKEILEERSPAFLFLTHAHWDHVGSAGFFKKEWPDLKVVASPESRALLHKPSVLETVGRLNQKALEALHKWGVSTLNERPFVSFEIDEIVTPGKKFFLSENISVLGRPSPGHTRDFTVYWIPEKRILIASEAAGCDGVPEFLVDYDIYLKDIEYFVQLNAEVLCTGHKLVITGEDVRPYLKEAYETAEKYRERVEALLSKGKSINAVVEVLKCLEWVPKPFPKQPLSTYLMNTETRVRALKKRWEKKSLSLPQTTERNSCNYNRIREEI